MLQNRGLSRLILKYTLGFCAVLSCVHFPFRRSPFIPATTKLRYISMTQKTFSSSTDQAVLIHCYNHTSGSEFTSLIITSSVLSLTCRASPSLDRCLWLSVGGGTASAAAAAGVQVRATGPGGCRGPSGSWRAACRCAFGVQGVTWWCWTGCGHLLHTGERHQ